MSINITDQQKKCIRHLLQRPNHADSAYGIANAIGAKVLGVTMSLNGLRKKTKGKIFCYEFEWMITYSAVEEMNALVADSCKGVANGCN